MIMFKFSLNHLFPFNFSFYGKICLSVLNSQGLAKENLNFVLSSNMFLLALVIYNFLGVTVCTGKEVRTADINPSFCNGWMLLWGNELVFVMAGCFFLNLITFLSLFKESIHH